MADDEKIRELANAVFEHKLRLENGVKAFQDFDERVAKVEQQTAPPSVSAIVGVVLSIVLAVGGALWFLANSLRDRPTNSDMVEKIQLHDETGHDSMRDDLRALRDEQIEQRNKMKAVGDKLDQLLERLPLGGRRR